MADVGLAGEMIDFVGSGFGDDFPRGGWRCEVAGVKEEACIDYLRVAAEVAEGGLIHGVKTADQTMDFVTLGEEKLSEVGTVLTGNAGDHCAFSH